MPILIVKAVDHDDGRGGSHYSSSPRNPNRYEGHRSKLPQKPKGYGQIEEDENSDEEVDQIAIKRRLDTAKANFIKKNMTKTHYVNNISEVLESLDFKVYHLATPPPMTMFDYSVSAKPQPTATKLIGEIFYDEKERAELRLPNDISDNPDIVGNSTLKVDASSGAVRPSDVLHKFNVLKYLSALHETSSDKQASMLQKFNANYNEVKKIKAGQRSEQMMSKSENDTLEWAIMYVNRNETNLITDLVAISTDVKQYIEELTR